MEIPYISRFFKQTRLSGSPPEHRTETKSFAFKHNSGNLL